MRVRDRNHDIAGRFPLQSVHYTGLTKGERGVGPYEVVGAARCRDAQPAEVVAAVG